MNGWGKDHAAAVRFSIELLTERGRRDAAENHPPQMPKSKPYMDGYLESRLRAELSPDEEADQW